MIISVLIVLIISILLIGILVVISTTSKAKKPSDVSGRIQKKGKSAILKEAEKKLARNPRDITALRELGNIYFEDKNWEKAYGVYKTLFEIAASNPEVNVAEASLRMGIAANKLGRFDDSLSALMLSYKIKVTFIRFRIFLIGKHKGT